MYTLYISGLLRKSVVYIDFLSQSSECVSLSMLINRDDRSSISLYEEISLVEIPLTEVSRFQSYQ